MWTPLDVPIEVSRNGVTGIGMELWDDVANAPLDISGLNFTCKVARALGEPEIASFPVEVIDASLGELDLIFDGSAIGIAGSQEIIQLAYEVKTNGGDTVLRGPLNLIPGI